MAEGIKEKKDDRCEYRSFKFGDYSYCGRKIDKRYPDIKGRNFCIFHSHNDEKGKEFYKLINDMMDKANAEVRKAIDTINSKETEVKKRSEKIEGIRKDKQLNLAGFYFPGAANFSNKKFETSIDFSRVTFNGAVYFNYVVFRGKTNFWNAAFIGNASFSRATFSVEADFIEATFSREANFIEATFKGRVDFKWATFNSKTYFELVAFNRFANYRGATFNEEAQFKRAIFDSEAYFMKATFKGITHFGWAIFNGQANYEVTRFIGGAFFKGTTFNSTADFYKTTFRGKADFYKASFNCNADFLEARFMKDIDFDRSTINKMDFSAVDLKRASFNRASLHLCYIDDIQYSDRTMKGIFIDTFTANTNRIFARDAADYNYLRQRGRNLLQPWRDLYDFVKHRKRLNLLLILKLPFSILKMILFFLWGLSSNFGRWFFLWLLWCLAIAIGFGYIYDTKLQGELLYEPNIKNVVVKIDDNRSVIEKYQEEIPSFAPFYYSIVTFTTLGFGDVIPVTDRARWYVAAEVVAGYLMLGALISILANKFARRA